jgi:hypothetical protein
MADDSIVFCSVIAIAQRSAGREPFQWSDVWDGVEINLEERQHAPGQIFRWFDR